MPTIEQQINSNQWYTVAALVDDWVDDHELHNFWAKALKWAIKALEELHLNHWGQIKTCLADVTERKTVTLPGDFHDWIKIGAPYGQYAVILGTNEDLRLTDRGTDTLGSVTMLSQNPPNGINFANYDGNYFFNYDGLQVFGLGPGISSKGYYRVYDNGNCKELLMDFDYGCSQVYIEYITNGFDPCGETIIDPYHKQYVERWMDYRYEIRNNPKATESSKERCYRDLGTAERVLRANRSNLTPQVLINLDRKHFKLTPKI